MIYSQVAIQYVDRKDQLIEEVWRVLKPGGKAFLNIDARPEDVPDFLNFVSPRFIIYKNNGMYPLRKFIKDFQNKGFDILKMRETVSLRPKGRGLEETVSKLRIFRMQKFRPKERGFIPDEIFCIKYKYSIGREEGKTKRRINLIINKNKNNKLDLKLKFDGLSSFY